MIDKGGIILFTFCHKYPYFINFQRQPCSQRLPIMTPIKKVM